MRNVNNYYLFVTRGSHATCVGCWAWLARILGCRSWHRQILMKERKAPNMACCSYKLLKAAELAVTLERIGGFHDIVRYPRVLRVRLLGLTFDAQSPHVLVLVSMEVPSSVRVQLQWVHMAFVLREYTSRRSEWRMAGHNSLFHCMSPVSTSHDLFE